MIISTFMIIYQVTHATRKLISPPVVDSTEVLDISDVDLPLITVCPSTTYINSTNMLKEYGYYDYTTIMEGYVELENATKFVELDNATKYLASWGKHLNLTFDNFYGTKVVIDHF